MAGRMTGKLEERIRRLLVPEYGANWHDDFKPIVEEMRRSFPNITLSTDTTKNLQQLIDISLWFMEWLEAEK